MPNWRYFGSDVVWFLHFGMPYVFGMTFPMRQNWIDNSGQRKNTKKAKYYIDLLQNLVYFGIFQHILALFDIKTPKNAKKNLTKSLAQCFWCAEPNQTFWCLVLHRSEPWRMLKSLQCSMFSVGFKNVFLIYFLNEFLAILKSVLFNNFISGITRFERQFRPTFLTLLGRT